MRIYAQIVQRSDSYVQVRNLEWHRMPATNVSESQIILSNAIATSYLQLRPAHKMEIPQRERERENDRERPSVSFSFATIQYIHNREQVADAEPEQRYL